MEERGKGWRKMRKKEREVILGKRWKESDRERKCSSGRD